MKSGYPPARYQLQALGSRPRRQWLIFLVYCAWGGGSPLGVCVGVPAWFSAVWLMENAGPPPSARKGGAWAKGVTDFERHPLQASHGTGGSLSPAPVSSHSPQLFVWSVLQSELVQSLQNGAYPGQLRQWPRCAVAAARGAGQAGTPFLHFRPCLLRARDAEVAAAVRGRCAVPRPDASNLVSSRRRGARRAASRPARHLPAPASAPPTPRATPRRPIVSTSALFAETRPLFAVPSRTQARAREGLWSPPPPPGTPLKPFAILQGPQVGAAADGARHPYSWGSLHP